MMVPRRGHGGPNSIDGGRGVSFTDWVDASWRRRSDGGSAGWLPPSGRKWQGAQSCQGATELVLRGPALGQMQSELARRAGEPSGDREEPLPQGLGGDHVFAQTARIASNRTLPKGALHVMTLLYEAPSVSLHPLHPIIRRRPQPDIADGPVDLRDDSPPDPGGPAG